MMKIGKDSVEGGNKRRKLSYKDIVTEPEQWIDAHKCLPADYDLVDIKVKGKGIISGWSVGRKWEGLRLKNSDEVLEWKKKPVESFKIKLGM